MLISRVRIVQRFPPAVPSVSFDEFAPNFVQRFIESHIVMLTGNAGLKPKEGEYTSRPWEWPINIRGQYFSGKDHRVYLLGNPVIWWGNIVFLLLFGLTYMWNLMREQRGHVDSDPAIRSVFASRILNPYESMKLLAFGYIDCHYEASQSQVAALSFKNYVCYTRKTVTEPV